MLFEGSSINYSTRPFNLYRKPHWVAVSTVSNYLDNIIRYFINTSLSLKWYKLANITYLIYLLL
jgi:hypothetical protein